MRDTGPSVGGKEGRREGRGWAYYPKQKKQHENLLKVKFSFDPVYPSVGRLECLSAGRSVIIPKKDGKFHFQTPIGVRMFYF